MDIDSALVLPLEVVPLPVVWQGQITGSEDCAPVVFDAGEAFLPGYVSGITAVIFGLHPVRDFERAKGAAHECINRNCI